MPIEDSLEEIITRTSESAEVDFKSTFDVAKAGEWLELIKDISSMANSGGGVILIGVSDHGVAVGGDISHILAIDPADLTNRIHKYTATHFHGFEFVECLKDGKAVCALIVSRCRVPMVFTKVGTYEVADGKQKTAFSVGTVYFRHGAKSEPGTSDDLRAFLDREIETVRRSWLDGIAKVVEAPTGSRFAILPPESQVAAPSGAMPISLTNDPAAPKYYAVPIDSTHPHRQKEVVREVNARLAGSRVINSHDILCIRRVHEIHKDIAFCYTQNYASPRYSDKFVEWVVAQYAEDSSFFEKTKAAFDALKAKNA